MSLSISELKKQNLLRFSVCFRFKQYLKVKWKNMCYLMTILNIITLLKILKSQYTRLLFVFLYLIGLYILQEQKVAPSIKITHRRNMFIVCNDILIIFYGFTFSYVK